MRANDLPSILWKKNLDNFYELSLMKILNNLRGKKYELRI